MPGETTEEVSLRDELSSQFDAQESGTPAPPPPSPSPAPPPEPRQEATESPAPGPAAAPPPGQKPGDNPAQDAKDVAALEAAAAEGRPIPARLRAKWGEKWATIDPAIREEFHAYESHIGSLASKYGKQAKSWEQVEQIFTPYMDMLRQEGGDVHGALSRLLETHRILRYGHPAQKAAFMQSMMQKFGVQLPQPGPDGQPVPGADPALIERLTNLERQVLTRDAEVNYSTAQRVNSDVQAFTSDPANIYLQEPGFLAKMTTLIASGQAEDLQSAYEQAAWLFPRTRELEIAKRQQAQVQAHQQQAATARRNAVSVSGRSPGTQRLDPTKMTTRQALEAAFDGDLDS